MFISRDIEKTIKAGALQIPVVAVIGPRQSGKSTLVKQLFPKHTYLDMQDAELFAFANSDPKGFLQTYKNEHGIIIDEAQYAPNLFPQIKVEADKNPSNGYFILSGSQNFLLHEKISESLAGRVYFYTLLPLSIKELEQAGLLSMDQESVIVGGFYPRIFQPNVNAATYYENYIATYVERDIRTIKNIDNILTFKKFIQLCALRIGSTINFNDLATTCGISVATVKSWLALLQTSFIIFQQPAYHENLGKRLTKSPKLFFYDVGLAAALMGVNSEKIRHKRELHGALFENMIIVDVMKNFYAQGRQASLMFFRDSNQNEIDLIIECNATATPIEIKASHTIKDTFFQMPVWFAQTVSESAQPIVVYGGLQEQNRSDCRVVPWNRMDNIVAQIK